MSMPLPGAGRRADLSDLSPRQAMLAIFVLSINFGVVFFDRNAVGFLVPFIQKDLDLSNSEIGALAAALALTWALSGYFVGHLADQIGRRKLIIMISTAVFSLSSFISGLAWSFATLLVARLLMGLAEGGVMPVSQSLTADLVSEKRRGLAMGAMQAFGSNLFGGMIAPLVLIGLATQFGWRITFYLTAVPGLLSVMLMAWLVPDRPLGHQGPIDAEGHVLGSSEPLGLRGLLGRNVILCCVISVCLVAYNAICWYFVPVFLTKFRGLGTQEMSWLVAMLGLSAVFTGFAIPALSDHWGRNPVMILFSLVGLLMPLSALYLPAGFKSLAPGFFIGWAILGVYPIFMSIIPVETVGSASAAKVLGLVVGAGELFGGVLGPAAAGIVADMTDLTAPLWMMAGLALAGALLSFGLIETAPARIGAKSPA
ncbi:MAG TPA: MFS transporter [Novosphingobium sp.]|nr:MFS transporter [Novosphingobium sp.]